MKKILYLSTLILITLCFSGCWGRGWLMPYSFQPSYHKFKKMCKLNELPNDEYKYNKILSYFDTDLDRLDWNKLNQNITKISTNASDYRKDIHEYRIRLERKNFSDRIEFLIAEFYSNQPQITKHNLTGVEFDVYWDTQRYKYYLSATSYKWRKIKDYLLWCDDVKE